MDLILIATEMAISLVHDLRYPGTTSPRNGGLTSAVGGVINLFQTSPTLSGIFGI